MENDNTDKAEEIQTSTESVGDVTEEQENKISTDSAPVKETVEPAFSEDISHTGGKFGEYEVNVTIPSDIANFANEHGFSAEEISKELYSSDDFTLSEETMSKLYDEFGKWQVDSYLSGLKAKNEMYVKTYKEDLSSKEAAATSAWESTLEIMEGEDRWEDMSAFAESKMTPEEIEEFNTVMSSGTIRMQQLFIKDLYSQFKEAGKPETATVLDLEDGDKTVSGNTGEQPLSAEAYFKLITSGEYKKDPAKYDKLRRAGMSKGL